MEWYILETDLDNPTNPENDENLFSDEAMSKEFEKIKTIQNLWDVHVLFWVVLSVDLFKELLINHIFSHKFDEQFYRYAVKQWTLKTMNLTFLETDLLQIIQLKIYIFFFTFY